MTSDSTSAGDDTASAQRNATASSAADGATLQGTTTVAAVNGVATFDNVWLDKAASGYTLTASAGSIVSEPSGSFDASPTAPVTRFETRAAFRGAAVQGGQLKSYEVLGRTISPTG